MQLKKVFVVGACGIMLTVGGCFARGGASPQSEAESSATFQGTVAGQTEEVTPTGAVAAPEQAEAMDAAPDVAQTVENAAAINSYRLRISTSSESARGVDLVQIEGAYVKEPAAEQLIVDIQQGDQTQRLEMVLVDGVRYMHTGDMWLQTPEAIFHINEMTLITPEDVTGLLERMERIGVESVNGREAIHYRGGQELIPAVGTEGDTLDVSQVEFAQLDLWIDQRENVVSKLSLEARDTPSASAMAVVFEYYDFNASIAVEPPPTPAAAPATEVGRLVGFNLLLPTGSNIETLADNTLLVASTPYTFEEAEDFIEQALQNNAYTLVTKIGPLDNQIVYMFQRGEKTVNITVTSESASATKLQFASTP